jgi:hypothetical protein
MRPRSIGFRWAALSSVVGVALPLVYACGSSPAVLAGGDLVDMGGPGRDSATNPRDAGANDSQGESLPDGALPLDASARVDGGGPWPAGPLVASYTEFDINHLLWTGQSNSIGYGSAPPLSLTQPFGNLMFDTGAMPMGSCDPDGCTVYQTPTSLVPLVDGDTYFTPAETPSSGIANEVSLLAAQQFQFGTRAGYPAKHIMLLSGHGRSGNTYWCLRKGGCPYLNGPPKSKLSAFAQGMMEVQSAKALALAQGKSYVVRAVAAIHGESDHDGYTTGTSQLPLDGSDGTVNKIKTYADAVIEWQADYESSIKAITAQSIAVPLIITGLSGWVTTRESRLANLQLEAHTRSPGKVLLAAPGYIIEGDGQCLHYSSHGTRRLGEYIGKVYARTVFGGEIWEPVRPKAIARAGAVVTVQFYVPRPPLVFDTVQVAVIANKGFDVSDNGVNVAIASVALSGTDSVAITLAAAPVGPGVRVKYAQNQEISGARCTGPQRGARGNLRDSDDTPSQYADGAGVKYPLQNWGVNFDLPVP